jgi:predicted XRE-type DNA-binding protein
MSELYASVWDAIEPTPEAAENMKMRSKLMTALTDHLAKSGMSQSQAAKLLGVTQPRISSLVRGKISLFSLDTLIAMASRAGLKIEIRVLEPACAGRALHGS